MFVIRKNKLQEHFESNENNENKILKILRNEIDLDKYTDMKSEIQFSDLPLDKSDNEDMNSIRKNWQSQEKNNDR